MTMWRMAEEECEWNQDVVFCVANAIGNRLKNVRGVLILTILWGVCPVKSCCDGKKLEHCGECKGFPCTQLEEFAYDEKEGDCGVRLDQCKIWSALTKMRYAWIDDFLMKKAGVTKLPPQWNWIRYAVGEKMFAAVCLGENNQPKPSDADGESRTGGGKLPAATVPGYPAWALHEQAALEFYQS